jgi:aldehyde:ferredoxin oxidoreductase
MMLSGYAGKIGWIDLGEGSVSVKELDREIAKKYLGGKALGAYLLLRHLRPGTDPYDPDNVLIFITGPLSGTTFPAASRSAVMTRSPMTGTILDSYCGGFFGPHLKRAGFDALIVVGKAKNPAYIMVDDGKITIKAADHLWGLSTSETADQLQGEYKEAREERISVAAIGPAGEKRVRFANIVNDRRCYGRGGAGAVMGSKNLKAVVLKGNQSPAPADEAGFKEVVSRSRHKIAQHPLTGTKGVFPKVGTMMTLDLTQETGTLPTRNWQENTSEHAAGINAQAFVDHIVRPQTCYACPIGCSRETRAKKSGVEYVSQGPEYETMYAFGSSCDIKEAEVIIAANQLCADYGLDTISCGVVIGFAMECFEKGLITHKDTGGKDLSFGNGDALIDLVHSIGRREGAGQILAEGVKRASEKIDGSAEFAVHVKGLELPGYDPRGMKGQALTYAVSDRGGCHLRSNTLRTELIGVPRLYDRYAYDEKAEMVRELQLNYATYNCVIACLFGTFALSVEDYAEALSTILDWSITAKELRMIGERALNLTRLFNVREGFTRRDDTLPPRLFSLAATRGPSKGQVVDKDAFEKMLEEYYQCMGWDQLTGIPTDSKLKELGIQKKEFL